MLARHALTFDAARPEAVAERAFDAMVSLGYERGQGVSMAECGESTT